MTPAQIQRITRDLDDTVWPCAPVIEAAERALWEWRLARAPGLQGVHDRDRLREHRRQLMCERPEIAHDVTQVRRRSLALLLADWLKSVGSPPGRGPGGAGAL